MVSAIISVLAMLVGTLYFWDEVGWYAFTLGRAWSLLTHLSTDKLSYEEPLTGLPSDSENLPVEISYMRELLSYIKNPDA